jgi:hypothetical protein
MHSLRTGLLAVGLIAALGIGGHIDALGVSAAIAQTRSETIPSQLGRWTRTRFQAAKKHWAEHDQWFSQCNRELESVKKTGKRMSYSRQARFLEDCMRRKH